MTLDTRRYVILPNQNWPKSQCQNWNKIFGGVAVGDKSKANCDKLDVITKGNKTPIEQLNDAFHESSHRKIYSHDILQNSKIETTYQCKVTNEKPCAESIIYHIIKQIIIIIIK